MLPCIRTFTIFVTCSGTENQSCGENDVLQVCDGDNNCTVTEDCADNGQICHDMGAESHYISIDDMDMNDSGMDL